MKSQHAPFGPDSGELEAAERNRRKTTNHFSKEGKDWKEKDVEEIKTLGRLHIILCDTAQWLGESVIKRELCYLSYSKHMYFVLMQESHKAWIDG